MRKFLFIAVLSLSALALFSCKKDEKPAVTGDMMTFTGRIGNGGAKTEINGLEMTWSKGDQVRINGVDCGSDLTTDRKTATFTGAVTPANEYKAYYPASLYDGSNYALPATQTYYPDSVNSLSDINPMYAYSSTTDLQFYNICALMKLVVKGKGTVKEIAVSANDTDGNPALLSGAFDIEGDASAGYYVEISSTGGSTSLTLDCDAGVELKEDQETVFYIALPQGEYKDLVFTLKDDTDGIYPSSPVTKKLEAGMIHVRELVGISIEKPKKLPGIFTVDGSGKEVQFSRGNLQYVKSTGEWLLAENQYDIVETDGQNVGDDYEDQNVVTLFGWGTSGWNNGNTNYMPYKTTDESDPDVEGYGYGPTKNGIYTYDLTGEFAKSDWGYSYRDYQVGTTDTWRTLTGGTGGEWEWLLGPSSGASSTNCRTTTSGVRYAKATIKLSESSSVAGLIIVPDNWSQDTYELQDYNAQGVSFATNTIAVDDWTTLEDAGCVFLPTAGTRYRSFVSSGGYYWSSSCNNNAKNACYLNFNNSLMNPTGSNGRYYGNSVRLVCTVK